MDAEDHDSAGDGHQVNSTPRVVFLLFVGLLGLGVAGAQASWGSAQAVLFCLAGVLMVVFPPAGSLPRGVWVLALVFTLCLGGAFLPDAWFPALGWRAHVGELGLDLGKHVSAQPQVSGEMGMVFLATLIVGLWIVSQRASPGGLRVTAMAFALGVAGAALLAMVFPGLARNVDNALAYGFFPNRNHNATLLAMGSLVSLGCLVQAMREKRGGAITLAAAATIITLWALLGWSLSRAGVVLIVSGALLWLALLGPRYLGRNGRRAVLMLAIAAVGGFLIAEPAVKQRLNETLRRSKALGAESRLEALDFRVPTWLDTAAMIRQRPWTGFGPGQFVFVFPQYRERSANAQGLTHLHPESDWLWLAAEAGIPAAIALAGIIGIAAVASVRGLGDGQARALRAACLVAALVLVLHSLADVPGHRVPLAWSGALLLGLSLRSLPGRQGRGRAWIFRLGGLAVLALGLALAFAERSTAMGPATTAGRRAVQRAVAISRARVEAKAKGEPPPASSAEVRQLIAEALTVVPMDEQLHFLRGVSIIDLPGELNATRQAFALERALTPTGIKQTMRQAATWAPRSSYHAAETCRVARRQAASLDSRAAPPPAGAPSWTTATEGQVVQLARRYPNLARRLGIPVPKRQR